VWPGRRGHALREEILQPRKQTPICFHLCLDVEHFGKALVHCESDGGGGNHADEVGSQALVEAAYFHKRVSNAAVFDRET
jgi:hypothetical protein